MSVPLPGWLIAGIPAPGRSTTVVTSPLSAAEARGQATYGASCTSCHGPYGEGQSNWKSRRTDGAYLAPPHDWTGHTWHHGDGLLFGIVKQGGSIVASRVSRDDAGMALHRCTHQRHARPRL